MKIVLVTGELAYGSVLEVARTIEREFPSVEVVVLTLPIPVAAMMNSEFLLRELPKYAGDVRGADLVVVPGYAEGDMSEVSRALGTRVVKGPRNAFDLPLMVKALLSGVQFSEVEPADVVLAGYLAELERKLLDEAKEKALKYSAFLVGNTPVSSHYPLVVLEIYARTTGDLEKYVEASKYADVVSVGFPVGFSPEEAVTIVDRAREVFGKPVGVDTTDLSVVSRVSELVDFVNGIPADSVERVAEIRTLLSDKPLVVIAPPGPPSTRVKALKRSARYLAERGFEKVVVDPVLMPPLQGLVESLEAYLLAKREMPSTPVLMGVGNVTELADVDSIGLNALLAFIGVEIGVELFLTTEASTKTRGSSRELRKALDMAVLARGLKRPPKDLSINLLVVKSKKRAVYQLPKAELVVRASEKPAFVPDPLGYFKISVDHKHGDIVVQHYSLGSPKPDVEVRGIDPYAIFAEIARRGLLSRIEHAFYLGVELSKAHRALKTGGEYEQDT